MIKNKRAAKIWHQKKLKGISNKNYHYSGWE